MNGLVSLKEFPSVQNEMMSDGLVDEYQGCRGVPLLMIGAPATSSEHSYEMGILYLSRLLVHVDSYCRIQHYIFANRFLDAKLHYYFTLSL
jgi:hypothetical protein